MEWVENKIKKIEWQQRNMPLKLFPCDRNMPKTNLSATEGNKWLNVEPLSSGRRFNERQRKKKQIEPNCTTFICELDKEALMKEAWRATGQTQRQNKERFLFFASRSLTHSFSLSLCHSFFYFYNVNCIEYEGNNQFAFFFHFE